MCITNAHRSGVLINFLTDYYDKRMVAEDGNTVITVCDNKTSSTHGAATICVSHEEGQLLDGYLNMRNCLLQNAPSTCISESHREADDTINRNISTFLFSWQ